MSYRCPQCGADVPAEQLCEQYFNVAQLKELDCPAYYAVHHLSVPCYMLQHNVYSARGWLEVRDLLSKFVDDGWTPEMARRAIRTSASSSNRKWSFTRGEKLAAVANIRWSFTIGNVKLDTADSYCSDVHRWAECVLADSEELMRSAKSASD